MSSNKNDSVAEVPYDLDAERAIIGSILLNNELYGNVQDILHKDYFYEKLHVTLFETIGVLLGKGLVANTITVKSFLSNKEISEELNLGEYLLKIVEFGGVIVDSYSYAKIIYNCFIKRNLITIGGDIISRAQKGNVSDNSVEDVERAEQELFSLISDGSSYKGFVDLSEPVKLALLSAENAYKNKGKVNGIPTKFLDLDRLLGGLQNSDLVILAARPSMGKTALAINVGMNACYAIADEDERKKKENPEEDLQQGSVGFFSLEMSSEQLAARIIAMDSEVNSSKIRSGDLNDDEFSRLIMSSKKLNDVPLYIDDTPALTISSIQSRARRLKRKHNIKLLLVDYLQLIRGTATGGSHNRVAEVSEITQGLKSVAKELNIPVIALSQLSRSVEQREDKRPQLADLRDSGSIEQDADVVMFIYREEYYARRQEPELGTEKHQEWQEKMAKIMHQADVIIAKQRNGPIGSVRLSFDSNTTKFDNYSNVKDFHEPMGGEPVDLEAMLAD